MKVMCNKTIKFCPRDKVVLEEAEGEDFGVKQYVSLWMYSTLKDILWWITFRDGLPVMSDLESTGVC
jgi:hypothetical protein